MTSQSTETDQHAACRKATGRAWSAFLDLALSDRLDDGTPVLSLVFAYNPDLADRLHAALTLPPATTTEEGSDA